MYSTKLQNVSISMTV